MSYCLVFLHPNSMAIAIVTAAPAAYRWLKFWGKGVFLSNQSICGFKRVGWTLIAFVFLVLLPLGWNLHVALETVQQSRVDKTLDFCPEDWKGSHREQKVTTDYREGGAWLSDSCKFVYELLGSLPSCTYMDLILNSMLTVVQLRTKWKDRQLPRSQTGQGVAHIQDWSK